MNTEQEFFEILRADPDNLAARLIFADWLDEEGDPRGEFIRVQCDLEQPGLSALKRRWLHERERAILEDHEAEWLGPIFPIGYRKLKSAVWTFRRGFVERVELDAKEFIERSEVLHPAFPLLNGLALKRLDQRADVLANSPALERFTGLQIKSNHYHRGHDGLIAPLLRELLDSPHLVNLRSLNLESCELGDESIRAVAARSHLRLHSLNLDHNRAGLNAIGALAAATCVSELTTLSLGSNHLTMDVLLLLSFSSALKNLATLDLRGNRLGSADNLKGLASLRRLPALKHLDLRSCGVGDAGLAALVKSPLWPQLETVVLWNNGITERGLLALAEQDSPGKLTSLDLQRNNAGDVGLMALAASPLLKSLKALHLEVNQIGEAGVTALVGRGLADQLNSLHLRGNPITDQAGELLARAELPRLNVLDLAGTQVGDQTARALAASPSSARLRVLDLAKTQVTETGVRALAESQYLTRLEFLDLRMNRLNRSPVLEMFQHLPGRVFT